MNTQATAATVDLSITGMSCNACAMSIEKGLNAVSGVTATVNFATETARVDYDPATTSAEQLIGVVAGLGYGARLEQDTTPDMLDAEVRERVAMLRIRLTGSIVLGLPVVALSMVPGLQFDGWQWAALVLSTPVATWGAWPFHRAALMNARHRATTMDTLISMGTSAGSPRKTLKSSSAVP